jgi:methylase of polypeptide subunit release factors
MSRIAPTIIKKAAQRIDPYLSLLLKEAGTIKAARNELRWLKEHVESSKTLDCNYIAPQKPPHDPLLELCKRRSKSEPLQYILGSQPFGELDILCEPGVLIPRRV